LHGGKHLLTERRNSSSKLRLSDKAIPDCAARAAKPVSATVLSQIRCNSDSERAPYHGEWCGAEMEESVTF
jgi:hypothetical protein